MLDNEKFLALMEEQNELLRVQNGILRSEMNKNNIFQLGLGVPPQPDTLYIDRVQGEDYLWYRLTGPDNDIKVPIYDTAITGIIKDIRFKSQRFESKGGTKYSSKVIVRFDCDRQFFVRTTVGSVAFISFLQALSVVKETYLLRAVCLELEPSSDPKKPTAVFCHLWDAESGIVYDPPSSGSWDGVDWNSLINEGIHKIKNANGLKIPSREEMTLVSDDLIQRLGIDGQAYLRESWGYKSRSQLNDGEYESFIESLEALLQR